MHSPLKKKRLYIGCPHILEFLFSSDIPMPEPITRHTNHAYIGCRSQALTTFCKPSFLRTFLRHIEKERLILIVQNDLQGDKSMVPALHLLFAEAPPTERSMSNPAINSNVQVEGGIPHFVCTVISSGLYMSRISIYARLPWTRKKHNWLKRPQERRFLSCRVALSLMGRVLSMTSLFSKYHVSCIMIRIETHLPTCPWTSTKHANGPPLDVNRQYVSFTSSYLTESHLKPLYNDTRPDMRLCAVPLMHLLVM